MNEFQSGSYDRIFTTGGPVSGGGGYPESINEIAEALLSLENLGAERAILVEKGMERARRFDLEDTVCQAIEVYRLLAA